MTAVSEVERRVENLWQRGRSNGRSDNENFGRNIGQHYFKAFASASPYHFGNKKWLCVDKWDEPWDMILPCLSKHDERRRYLMTLMFLVLGSQCMDISLKHLN